MRRRLAAFLRRLAWWVDPHVYRPPYRTLGPISREDVDDFYAGIPPEGRRVL